MLISLLQFLSMLDGSQSEGVTVEVSVDPFSLVHHDVDGVTTRERHRRRAVTGADMQELASDLELETDVEEEEFGVGEVDSNKLKEEVGHDGLLDDELGADLDDAPSTTSEEEEEEEEEEDNNGNPPQRRTRARSEREEQEKDLSEFYQLLCSECGLKCNTFISLSSHCKAAHDCRPTVRCHCNKMFNRRSHLIRHRHQHLGVHRFK
jgi:hypothetical protein